VTIACRATPGLGQESVWDYPRPPRLEDFDGHVEVVFHGVTIAETKSAKRVLETSHPPVFYLPHPDIRLDYVHPQGRTSWCEWKGEARYFDVRIGDLVATAAAWAYPHPKAPFTVLKDHLGFYPALMDACLVNGERVTPQPGGFYGGWITPNIVGPFKGTPGSHSW